MGGSKRYSGKKKKTYCKLFSPKPEEGQAPSSVDKASGTIGCVALAVSGEWWWGEQVEGGVRSRTQLGVRVA